MKLKLDVTDILKQRFWEQLLVLLLSSSVRSRCWCRQGMYDIQLMQTVQGRHLHRPYNPLIFYFIFSDVLEPHVLCSQILIRNYCFHNIWLCRNIKGWYTFLGWDITLGNGCSMYSSVEEKSLKLVYTFLSL